MKMFFVIIGILVALAIVAFVGRFALVVVSSKKPASVSSVVTLEPGALICSLTLVDSDRPMTVTELYAARSDVESIGLVIPDGFRPEAMPGEGDPEYAKQWNLDNARFVGELKLTPGTPVTLRIPVSGNSAAPFVLRGQMEGKWGIGGTIVPFRISVPSFAASTTQ